MKIQTTLSILASIVLLGCGSEVVPTGDMGGTTTGMTEPPPGVTVNPTTPDPTTPDPTTPDPTTGDDSTTSGGADDTAGDDTGGDTTPDGRPDTTPVQPYASCTTDDDCGGGMSCLDMFGVSVCTKRGCAEDESICDPGSTCMVSAAVYPDGVCTNTGSDQFCALRCRDVLMCNLDPACASEGCCDALDNAGCPSSCSEIDPMECEIAPACPVECCGA